MKGMIIQCCQNFINPINTLLTFFYYLLLFFKTFDVFEVGTILIIATKGHTKTNALQIFSLGFRIFFLQDAVTRKQSPSDKFQVFHFDKSHIRGVLNSRVKKLALNFKIHATYKEKPKIRYLSNGENESIILRGKQQLCSKQTENIGHQCGLSHFVRQPNGHWKNCSNGLSKLSLGTWYNFFGNVFLGHPV